MGVKNNTITKRRLFINLSSGYDDYYLIRKNGYVFNPNYDFCMHEGGSTPKGVTFDEVVYLPFYANEKDLLLTENKLRFLREVRFQVVTRATNIDIIKRHGLIIE